MTDTAKPSIWSVDPAIVAELRFFVDDYEAKARNMLDAHLLRT